VQFVSNCDKLSPLPCRQWVTVREHPTALTPTPQLGCSPAPWRRVVLLSVDYSDFLTLGAHPVPGSNVHSRLPFVLLTSRSFSGCTSRRSSFTYAIRSGWASRLVLALATLSPSSPVGRHGLGFCQSALLVRFCLSLRRLLALARPRCSSAHPVATARSGRNWRGECHPGSTSASAYAILRMQRSS
jgi:hypothetical protein